MRERNLELRIKNIISVVIYYVILRILIIREYCTLELKVSCLLFHVKVEDYDYMSDKFTF